MSKLEKLKTSSIKTFSIKELEELCSEIREFLIHSVTITGGHLSSNLGVVELTVALHYCFNLPTDSLLFDVSHQSYVHKILTGRIEHFSTLRQKNGLSGFTNPYESKYDVAIAGHAGTSISITMGIQKAKLLTEPNKTPSFGIAMVGDASIANGVAFEAFNNISSLNLKNTLVILNDNQMSISKSVGGISQILTRIISNPYYNKTRIKIKRILRFLGKPVKRIANRVHDSIKHSVYNNVFEEFGMRYLGPIDGHNMLTLIKLFNNLIKSQNKLESPLLLHVITKKGKGNELSEKEPEKYHGVAKYINQIGLSYTNIFDKTICEMAQVYNNIVATTAAMKSGTGLCTFSKEFPHRFFDVGITESHAVVFSSFLSYSKKLKPYIAIYSTFLQRAIDQIFEEVILQPYNTPVFIIDRGGFCGEDGTTHHGLYDIAYLKSFPKSILLSPKSGDEFALMLKWSYTIESPLFIRVPKAITSTLPELINTAPIEIGKSEWVLISNNAQFIIIAYGPIIEEVLLVKENLPPFNLLNLRFAKPLDLECLKEISKGVLPVFTLEEHAIIGGVGESITRILLNNSFKGKIINLGVEDFYFGHATRKELLEEAKLKGAGLVNNIIKNLS